MLSHETGPCRGLAGFLHLFSLPCYVFLVPTQQVGSKEFTAFEESSLAGARMNAPHTQSLRVNRSNHTL